MRLYDVKGNNLLCLNHPYGVPACPLHCPLRSLCCPLDLPLTLGARSADVAGTSEKTWILLYSWILLYL